MALEEAFNELRNNLYRPFIFFIPKSLIPEQKKELFDSPEIAQLFNKVAIIENSGEIYELKFSKGLFQILEKPSILNGNIFLLSDQKAVLNSFQFNLLMEKYQVQLQFYTKVSKWMALHSTEHCVINDDIKSYFELQDTFYQNHLNEIETKFKIKITTQIKPIDLLNHIEKDLSPLKKLIRDNKVKSNGANFNHQKNQTKVKKVKPVLLTDQEAKSFLLKSVFHILN